MPKDFKRLAEAHAKTERELKEESANSLGRAGRALDQAIAQVHAVKERFAACTREEQAAVRAEFALARAEAHKLLWYLQVQREALGLRRHDELLRQYPIPDPLPRE